MATFQALKNPSGASEQMAGVGDGQSLKCVSSTYSIAAALASGDIIQSALIQAGSVIVDVMVVASDMDSGTTITCEVGYGGDTDYFIVSGATPLQAGGVVRASAATAVPLLLTTNDTVDVKITAGPGTATSGTVTINVFFLSRNSA